MALITNVTGMTRPERLIIAEVAKEYIDINRSTSPYAITQEKPRERIEVMAKTSGGSGFYKGTWSVDTKPEYNTIYICPVTGSEFISKDLEEYMKKVYRDAKTYAETKLGEIRTIHELGKTNLTIKTDMGIYEYNPYDDVLTKGQEQG